MGDDAGIVLLLLRLSRCSAKYIKRETYTAAAYSPDSLLLIFQQHVSSSIYDSECVERPLIQWSPVNIPPLRVLIMSSEARSRVRILHSVIERPLGGQDPNA